MISVFSSDFQRPPPVWSLLLWSLPPQAEKRHQFWDANQKGERKVKIGACKTAVAPYVFRVLSGHRHGLPGAGQGR